MDIWNKNKNIQSKFTARKCFCKPIYILLSRIFSTIIILIQARECDSFLRKVNYHELNFMILQ